MRRRVIGGRSSLRAGFTLVELSIVIVVMSVLFTLMFSVFFGVSQITKEATPSSRAKQKALLALEMMRSTVNQTYYNRDIDRLIFLGRQLGTGDTRRDRLTLAAVHPHSDALGVPAVREVSFYVTESKVGEDTGTLMRREDQLVDNKPGEGGAHYPVMDNVVSLQFRYSLSGKEWKESWSSKEMRRVPRLVHIIMRVKIGQKTHRFETLAAPGLYIN
ncbi:MAG: prepilin-type N-terminal cleavage/methylation domain-containing protein [Spirochaetia bacterium]|nr:prepilin-type N-terminal cleavage/methylation domain-containing protein [Spirochaetia bacterium]